MRTVGLLLGCLLFSSFAAFGANLPPFAPPVMDIAGVFDEETKSAVAAELDGMLSIPDNPVCMVVLTVPGLDGEPIEDFAQRAFDKWGIGQKGLDNGILYVFAAADRKYRIHTGRGIEGLIPDGKAGEIGRKAVPDFKAGNYGAGIQKVVSAIHAHIVSPKGDGNGEKEGGNGESTEKRGSLFEMILGGIVFFGLMLLFCWKIIAMFIDLFTCGGFSGSSGSSSSGDSSGYGSSRSYGSSSGSSSGGDRYGGGGSSAGGGASGSW